MPQARSSESVRRGALDPRLLSYARAARAFIAGTIALRCIGALLIIAQAWLLASVVQRGRHSELVASDGPYAAMWQREVEP